MSNTCKHGSLARSCQICELEAEVERMEAAHQHELAQVKEDLKSCQAKNREQLEVNMGLRDSMHRIEQGVDVLIEQRDKLVAEIAALREDAERYRWLRNRLYFGVVDVGEAYITLKVVGSCPTEDQFDAAIDAARSKQ